MRLFAAQQIGQRQSVVITAQLQQAIHLLRMTNAELAEYIENQSEENPFLELGKTPGDDASRTEARLERNLRDTRNLDFPSRSGQGGQDFDLIASVVAAPKPSLYAHVTDSIEVMFADASDRVLAAAFLDALEPSGWLGESVEDIAEQSQVSLSDAEIMLGKLQKIEPAGLFARGLAECLELQARERGLLTPAFNSLLNNLPKLAAGKLRDLARACGCSTDELQDMMTLLRSLNPKPGAEFESASAPIRAPDLLVRRGDDGSWIVDFNRSTLASVIIRNEDAKRLGKGKGEASKYVTERVSQARYLERAVHHRNETTLRVGAEVMRRQHAFLEQGPSQIVPMVLREVADELDVHESTVSRVTAGLLIETPIGTFPLKLFFSAALSASDPEQAGSAASVRHWVQKIVQNEPADAPYSDDTIAQMVSDKGVQLARRTVAKYRDILKIPSSFQRRRRNKILGLVQ